MKTKILILLYTLIFPFNSSDQNIPAKNQLKADVGIIDITGDNAVILDPLHVKAVILHQGAARIELVECDVTGIKDGTVDSTRQIASLRTGIPYSNK